MQDFSSSAKGGPENITSPPAGLPAQAGISFFGKLKDRLLMTIAILVGSIAIFAAIIYAVYSYGKRGQEPQLLPSPTPVSITTPMVSPTTIEIVTPTPEMTTDWQVFTTKEYGFSVEYPPEWVRGSDNLEGEDKSVSFASSFSDTLSLNGDGAIISILLFTEDHHFYQGWIDNFNEFKKFVSSETRTLDGVRYKVQSESVDSHEAVRYTNETLPPNTGPVYSTIVVLKPSNNKVLVIMLQTVTKSAWEKHLATFNQVLFTFKFLD